MKSVIWQDILVFTLMATVYFFLVYMSFKFREKSSKKLILLLNIICFIYPIAFLVLAVKGQLFFVKPTYEYIVILFEKIKIREDNDFVFFTSAICMSILYYFLPLCLINVLLKRIYTFKSIAFTCLASLVSFPLLFALGLALGHS